MSDMLPATSTSNEQQSDSLSQNALTLSNAASRSQQILSSGQALNTMGQLVGVRIMVVDDEPDNLELLRFLLAEEGATVTTFISPCAALEMLTQVTPNLLISDIGMPEMNGYEFIQRVRLLPLQQANPTPAIALTAFAQTLDKERAIQAGYQFHSAKPIDPQEFILLVAQWAK